MSIQAGTFIAGILLGSLLMVTVCWTYAKKGTFGTGGSILSIVGVVLIGLSLWSSIELKAGDVSLKLDSTIDEVTTLIDQVETLAAATETARTQIEEVTKLTNQPPAAQQQHAAQIRAALNAAPRVDPQKLTTTRRDLERLRTPIRKPTPR